MKIIQARRLRNGQVINEYAGITVERLDEFCIVIDSGEDTESLLGIISSPRPVTTDMLQAIANRLISMIARDNQRADMREVFDELRDKAIRRDVIEEALFPGRPEL